MTSRPALRSSPINDQSPIATPIPWDAVDIARSRVSKCCPRALSSLRFAACNQAFQSRSSRVGCNSRCCCKSAGACSAVCGEHTGVSCSSNSRQAFSMLSGWAPYITAASNCSRWKSTPCLTVVVSSTGTSGRSFCQCNNRGNSQRMTQVGALSCRVSRFSPICSTASSIRPKIRCTRGSHSRPSLVRSRPRAWRMNNS
ncbi:hypothetical protein D3C73_1131110 [compost metagenome]